MILLNFKKTTAAFFFTICFLGSLSSAFAENVTMNISAKNATDQKKEKMMVRQDLPKEIKKDDIIELGELSLGYDEQQGVFYVYHEVDLEPKAQKDFKISVKDVWKSSVEDLDFLKSQADLRLKALEGKESYEAAKFFRDKVDATIDSIKALQDSQKADVEARINSYRVNLERISDIRQAVSLIDSFAREAERYADYEKEKRSITMVVDSQNTGESKLEQVEILRYLPQGIRPDYITDLQGFDLRYDPQKELFYLIRHLDFEPGESRHFEITIADLWHIPDSKLDMLEKLAQELSLKLVGSDYDKLASYMANDVKKISGDIKESQQIVKTPDDKISLYALNIKRLETIIKKINELRGMLDEMEKSKAKKITAVIKSVTPDVATTWKLIYATIAFLTIISFFFYILWWGQTKAKQNQKVDNIDSGEAKKK